MSTQFIMVFAIGVFVLMGIGMILTMVEFNKLTDDPSIRKGSGGPERTQQASEDANIRAVETKGNAA